MPFVFLFAAFAQISFWIALWVGFRRTRRIGRGRGPSPARAVSVIVTARNEEKALPRLVACLKAQSHPTFEVVLVDDGSTDATAQLAEHTAASDIRFKAVSNPATERGKKGALWTGISNATGDVLALTDADCRPGPDWLAAVSSQIDASDNTVVVGYGPYAAGRGFLDRLIRFETVTTALMTAAAVGLGKPYMAVGRNLFLSRSVVSRLDGSRPGAELLGGTDDLLVQAASRTGADVIYSFDPSSFVESDPPDSIRGWIHQKRRHLSASRAYPAQVSAALILFHGSSLLCWLAPVVIGLPGLAILSAKLITQFAITAIAARVFREPGLTAALPILDLAWLAYLVVVTPFAVLLPPRRWRMENE